LAIYRGAGGAGDAVGDASSEVLLALAAKDAAIAAEVAAETARDAAQLAETNAETAETNAAASAALAAGYLPSSSGNSGKYLKTNGTTNSWDAIEINTADITGTLPIANGGTNATTAADARTNFGVTATGSDTTYAYRANNLSDLSSASTARTNLGLGTIATQAANNVSITGGSITGITDLAVADGGTGSSTASGARTNLLAIGYTATTGSAIIPTGTTAQRDGSPASGYFRYNSTLNSFEGYNGTAWGAVGGGATGGSNNAVFYENDQTVTADYTISTNKNAMSAGTITINSGVTVTIPSGSTWVIV
jgi:hypothetical protein